VIILLTTLRTTSGHGPKPCIDLDVTRAIKTSGTTRKITHMCTVVTGRCRRQNIFTTTEKPYFTMYFCVLGDMITITSCISSVTTVHEHFGGSSEKTFGLDFSGPMLPYKVVQPSSLACTVLQQSSAHMCVHNRCGVYKFSILSVLLLSQCCISYCFIM